MHKYRVLDRKFNLHFDFFCFQMGANILLFVCTNILGAIDYYIADRKQRRSVLETRQSLEVKITLESENLQQVCTSIYSITCTIDECVPAQQLICFSLLPQKSPNKEQCVWSFTSRSAIFAHKSIQI